MRIICASEDVTPRGRSSSGHQILSTDQYLELAAARGARSAQPYRDLGPDASVGVVHAHVAPRGRSTQLTRAYRLRACLRLPAAFISNFVHSSESCWRTLAAGESLAALLGSTTLGSRILRLLALGSPFFAPIRAPSSYRGLRPDTSVFAHLGLPS